MASTTATITQLETRLHDLTLDSVAQQIPAADVLNKPLDIYRSHLASLLASTVGCDASVAYEAIATTNDPSFLGDLAVPLPRLRLKDVDVKTYASEVIKQLPVSPLFLVPYPDGIQIRFLFSTRSLPRLLLPYIDERKISYGQNLSDGLRHPDDSAAGNKKVIVEFSSPNVPGEFTGNHLRSTLLGSFVSRIYEGRGWDVTRLNYLGDWGKHVGLLAAGWQRFGSDELLQKDPLGHILEVFESITDLFQPELDASKQAKDAHQSTAEIEGRGIYAERDTFFKKLEDGDAEALAFWKRFNDISIANFKTAYDRLGINFHEYSGESQVKPETMAHVESVLQDAGVSEESGGSWVIDFEQHGGKGLGTQILRGRTGSSTYLLRDIAAAIDRETAYSFDKMIYVVSARQNSHFKQVTRALELMNRSDLAEKLQHISFGEIHGMSAHLNDAKTLGGILDQTSNLILDVTGSSQEVEGANARSLPPNGAENAISALISQDMSSRRSHGYTFDPKRIASLEGDSGLKLQSWHSKLSSKVMELQKDEILTVDVDYSHLEDETSSDVLRSLAQYPDVVAATFKSLEPHGVLTYLSRLVDSISYALEPGEEEGQEEEAGPSTQPEEDSVEVSRAKLALYQAAKQVLENGMKLLGFPIVE